MPSFLVFVLISMFGTFFALMSSGLLGLWLGLELGFFGFIPVLNGKTVGENEAACKYFIVQGVGSGLMLLGFLLVVGSSLVNISFMLVDSLMWVGVVVGLMIKLGMFPFHFWFPSVMSGSSWFSCFWLSVVQKVGPFWGLSGLGLNGWVLTLVNLLLVTTSLVGCLGGLAQTQFRSLLAYSSLGQAGWMGLVCILSLDVFMVYIFIYSVLLSGLLMSLHSMNSYSTLSLTGVSNEKGIFFWLFSGSFFMSISGVPPLAGCALKLMGIMIIVNYFPIYMVLLVLSSMISLYFYLSVFISSVVCVSDSMVSYYGLNKLNKAIIILLILFTFINWFGGFPLFLACANFIV